MRPRVLRSLQRRKGEETAVFFSPTRTDSPKGDTSLGTKLCREVAWGSNQV